MRKLVLTLLFGCVLLAAANVCAKKLPGPFPWGADQAEIMAEITGSFDATEDEMHLKVSGDTVTLGLGYAYGANSTLIMRFADDGLALARYEFRPLEGEEFIAAADFAELLANLRQEYGEPMPSPDKGYADAGRWYWETDTETINLVCYGEMRAITLVLAVYTAL